MSSKNNKNWPKSVLLFGIYGKVNRVENIEKVHYSERVYATRRHYSELFSN